MRSGHLWLSLIPKYSIRSLHSHPRRSQLRFPTRQKKATARPNLAVPRRSEPRTGDLRIGKSSKHGITGGFTFTMIAFQRTKNGVEEECWGKHIQLSCVFFGCLGPYSHTQVDSEEHQDSSWHGQLAVKLLRCSCIAALPGGFHGLLV